MFVVFVRPGCPYCAEAVQLMQQSGLEYKPIDVTQRPCLRDRLLRATGSATVPSVWVSGVYVGGLNSGPSAFGGLRAMLRGSLDSVRSHPDFGKPVPV